MNLQIINITNRSSFANINTSLLIGIDQSLLPLLPPLLLVESVGIGVTSSILPILIPFLARDLMTAYPPGPGEQVLTPPYPLILICKQLILKA